VNVFGGPNLSKFIATVTPFPSFSGGISVAAGDVNGDGTPDLIVGEGTGGSPRVKVVDGTTGQTLADFFAFAPSFTGGVFVAAGDVNGDGRADIIVSADASGGPEVKVIDGTKLNQLSANGQIAPSALLADFLAYTPGFTGGVRVAASDINGDGRADIIVGAGAGSGPEVKVIDGTRLNQLSANGEIAPTALLADFFAFAPGLTGGVFVAAGDVNGDGRADIIVGADAGGGPEVKVIDGAKLNQLLANGQTAPSALLADFLAFAPSFTGGVFVAAGDVNGDGRADVIVGAGPGGLPEVKVIDGTKLNQLSANGEIAPSALLTDIPAFGVSYTGGVTVAVAVTSSLDFGSAPAPYPTLLADNGARHLITGLRLGNTVIADPDGQPSPPNLADPDEDGVTFLSPFVANGTAAIKVNVQGATANGAKLDAFIDWSHDGSWNDPGDEVAVDTTVFNGDNTITINVPAAAMVSSATPTYARFRLSTAGGLAPTGLATDGEVEDYKITLSPCPNTVYVGPEYNGTPGTMVNGHTVGFDAFATIQQGVNVVCAGGTVNIAAGTYTESVSIGTPLTLQGAGSSTIIRPPAGNGVTFRTIKGVAPRANLINLRITGAENAAVSVSATGVTLQNDQFDASGTGVLLAGGAATLSGDKFVNDFTGINVTNGGQLTLGQGNTLSVDNTVTTGAIGLVVNGSTSRIANLTLSNIAFTGYGSFANDFYAELLNNAHQGPDFIDATAATFEDTAGANLGTASLASVEARLIDYHVDSGVGLLQLKKGGVFTGGPNLTIIGTDLADTINVNGSNPSSVTVSASFLPQGISGFDAHKGRVIIFALGGNDTINVTGTVETEIHGGNGNDTIYGGTGHNIIFGDAGNDTIVARGTADVLVGGGGQDVLMAMGGQDILIAGSLNAGYDTYNFLNQMRAEWLDTSNTAKAMLHDLAANGVTHPDLPSERCQLSHNGGGPTAFVYRKKGENPDKDYGLTANDTDFGF
jgi:hypothetical protein